MTLLLPDQSKTLEELDGEVWGDPEWQSSLVLTCHRLHRTPLIEFTPSDLRRMISQSFCLEFLAPLALYLLNEDPILEADIHPGDLLCALLASERSFWSDHPSLRMVLAQTADSARARFDTLPKAGRAPALDCFQNALSQFERIR